MDAFIVQVVLSRVRIMNEIAVSNIALIVQIVRAFFKKHHNLSNLLKLNGNSLVALVRPPDVLIHVFSIS